MAEEIKKEVKEEVKKQEEVPAEVVKEETVKADAPKEEAKVAPKKDKPKAETKKATGKKATAAKQEKKQEKKQEEVKKELPPLQIKTFSSSSQNTPISTLMFNVKRGKYDMNHGVQRKSEQWTLQVKEKFLESCLQSVVPQEIIICVQDGIKFVVDGKQRLSCLDEYINRQDTKLTVFGRKFSELDSDSQEFLKSRSINVVSYVNVDEKDIFSLFDRYNSGVSLSSSQRSRAYCSIKLLDRIKNILNSHFMSEICNITKGQALKDEDTMVIIQSCLIASGFEFKSFNSKETDRYLQETDTDSIMATLDIIEEHIKILDGIVSEKNKNLKKIHLPMILACANDTEAFKNKLLNFLNDYENQTEYRQYCQGSTSQKENVLGRLNYWKP